ncbi:F-box domain containing protein [Tanacetum coccineum]|uniref:F-box domain containing protein n=1 Tax=Tanacetum coccineum TaxID=301880 RepID=A0ABQ5HI30_9ASTR
MSLFKQYALHFDGGCHVESVESRWSILYELELIYPPALFDIMVHLVIHLPIEALEGGPIRPRWMYPFERYMKKLKGYVRNKAKPEGSIAEGYVAEEALTFSSHYFFDYGQSTVVDAPPDIIDVPDEDDDIIGDEDALPHDLADSDAEDLINVDDDGKDRGSLRTPSDQFEQGDKQTLNPLGPHAAHWSNYIGEVVRSVPLYYPSWEKVPKERQGGAAHGILPLDRDLRSLQTCIAKDLQYLHQLLSRKSMPKADPTTGSYDVEAIRRARPEEITAAEWDKYIKFWNDPKNLARAAQNRLNGQK